MKNAYIQITEHHKNDMELHLKQMNLFDIFQEVYEAYPDKKVCAKIVKFIVYCYTFGSPKIFFGTDRRKEKEKVFNDLGLPVGCYDDVMLMHNESVIVDSIIKWIRFDDEAQFEYLITIKDAFAQYQSAVLKGKDVDFKEKIKYLECMEDLKDRIVKAEQELKLSDPMFAEVFKEVMKTKSGGVTAGIETFLKAV